MKLIIIDMIGKVITKFDWHYHFVPFITEWQVGHVLRL